MRVDGLRRAATLGGVVGLPTVAVILLHRLGQVPALRVPRSDLAAWLATVPPADALMAALRLVALGCGYWLLASTALYVLARATRLPGAVGAVGWATLPALRRLVDRALAVTLVTSAALGTAPPAAGGPLEAPPADALVVPEVDDRLVPPGAPPGDAALRPGTEPAEADAAVVTVAAGDSLWRIAARHAPVEATGRYWAALVERNRAGLRSGDPDLIFPGERVRLPTGPEPPASVGAALSPPDAGQASAAEPTPSDAADAGPPGPAEPPGTPATYALPIPRELLVADPALMDRPHHTYPAWDVGVATGTPVFAIHAGTVVATPREDASGRGCGNGVIVDGLDGHRAMYCHGSAVAVTAGDRVEAGQLIMRSGNSGYSTGAHLHLEIRTPGGERVCPQPLLRAWFAGTMRPPAQAPSAGCVRGSRPPR